MATTKQTWEKYSSLFTTLYNMWMIITAYSHKREVFLNKYGNISVSFKD